jgi:hypothetical protein
MFKSSTANVIVKKDSCEESTGRKQKNRRKKQKRIEKKVMREILHT